MTELWIASANAKKSAELGRLLAPLHFRVRSLRELAEPLPLVVEDCPDFAGNAAKKAAALARAVRGFAVADDSGLCVDALGGAPGVHSARYAGTGVDDQVRVARLLAELQDVPPQRRTARFLCHICLCAPSGEVLARFEESCAGAIATAPRGEHGFGYDPVFVPAIARLSGRTFAQLTPIEKDAVSHRGIALRRLVAYLQEHPLRP
jgi:XTP/dITP diphosphohydrolase